MRRAWASVLVLSGVLVAEPSFAQRALQRESLREYIRGRDDLPVKVRSGWEKAIMMRFGGAALDEDSSANVQITVAKAIISTAIFMEADPKKAAVAAFEGYRGALGYVPPPLAIRYQILVLEGRKPNGTPEQLTFNFPKYYDDELAPEMVAYWERGLAEGSFPEDIRSEIREALAATRVKMRPLLAGKLRVLAQLALELPAARGAVRDELLRNIEELEAELARSFRGVGMKPEVLDRKKSAYERLRVHLAAAGLRPAPEDDALDPSRAAPTDAREAEARAARERTANERAAADRAREAERRDAEARTESERAASDEAREAERREAEARAEGARRDLARAQALAKEAADRARSEAARGAAERPRILLQLPPAAVATAHVEPSLRGAIQLWLGTPYRWGGTEKGAGTDCSGFTKGVAEESFVVGLPRLSRDQYRTGLAVATQAELLPGDLIFFDTSDLGGVNHVGFYAGGGRFAHASSSRGVIYDDLAKTYYQRAYRGARRILRAP